MTCLRCFVNGTSERFSKSRRVCVPKEVSNLTDFRLTQGDGKGLSGEIPESGPPPRTLLFSIPRASRRRS
jgi:hypothetical protein